MCKKAKEFSSESSSENFSYLKEKENDITFQELVKYMSLEEKENNEEEEIEEHINENEREKEKKEEEKEEKKEEKKEDEKEEEKKEEEKELKEDEKEEEKENEKGNKIYKEKNAPKNQEEFNYLEEANNYNLNNINQGDDVIQNIEDINGIKIQKISDYANNQINIITQNLIGMQSTGERTKLNIASGLNLINNKGEIKIKEDEKELKEYQKRNYRVIFVKGFFHNLINFINVLIENFNKKNQTKIDYLDWTNGNIYIHERICNALYLLDRKVIDALSSRAELFKGKDGFIKPKKKILPNKKLCYEIYKEKDEKMKIHEVIEVFDRKIKDLMDIYLNEVSPMQDHYKFFQRFEAYLNNPKNNIDKRKKKILIDVAYNYKSRLEEKITNHEHKRGSKAKIPEGE